MARTRKPATAPVARPSGRVANTTTTKPTSVSTNRTTVYRLPTGSMNTNCPAPLTEVTAASPIKVKKNGYVYHLILDKDALKQLIESYPDLDLSNVNVKLKTVSGDVNFTGSVKVDGMFETENANIKDTLMTNKLNVAGEALFDGEVVFGENATFEKDIEVKGTSNLKRANIENADIESANVDQLEARVVNVSEGLRTRQLDVDGQSRFNGEAMFNERATFNKDVDVLGDTNLNDLNVSGHTVLKDLEVMETSVFHGDVTSERKLTSNETTTRTLEVLEESNFKGDADFDKNVNVDGTATIDRADVRELNVRETATFNETTTTGTANFDGAVNTNGTLTANGETNLNGTTNVNGSLTANGESVFNGTVDVNNKATIKELEVKEDALFKKNVDVEGVLKAENAIIRDEFKVEGNADFDGNVNVDGNSNVEGNQYVKGNLTADRNLNVKGNAHIEGDLQVDGLSNLKRLNVTEEVALPDGSLDKQYQNVKEKGKPNGYAPLDENARVPMENLPEYLKRGMTFKGDLDASTGAFPETDTAKIGDYYIVTTAGTVEGNNLKVKDEVIFDGNKRVIIPNTADVTSVNGRKGDVVGLEENSNKVNVINKDVPTEEKYPSEKAVVDYVKEVKKELEDGANDKYATKDELATKADANHTHTMDEITGLNDTLSNKADLDNGKLRESQLPDKVITTDNIGDHIPNNIITTDNLETTLTKAMLEQVLGYEEFEVVIQLNGESNKIVNEPRVNKWSYANYNYETDVDGLVNVRVGDGVIEIDSVERQTGTIKIQIINKIK